MGRAESDSYYKFDPVLSTWSPFCYDGQTGTGAQIFPDHIRLNFVDDRRGDSSITPFSDIPDGIIKDPGGPVIFIPVAHVAGPATGVRGEPLTFTVSAIDLSPTKLAAGFTYTINWDDGSPLQTIAATRGNGAGIDVRHTYTAVGQHTVQVTATDAGGFASAPASMINEARSGGASENVQMAQALLAARNERSEETGTPLVSGSASPGASQLLGSAGVPGTEIGTTSLARSASYFGGGQEGGEDEDDWFWLQFPWLRMEDGSRPSFDGPSSSPRRNEPPNTPEINAPAEEARLDDNRVTLDPEPAGADTAWPAVSPAAVDSLFAAAANEMALLLPKETLYSLPTTSEGEIGLYLAAVEACLSRAWADGRSRRRRANFVSFGR